MKRWQAIFLLLWCIWNPRTGAQDTILLFHPTADNLDAIQKLHETGLLSTEGYHLLGVFHTDETYRYTESAAWIDAGGTGTKFSLDSVSGKLEPEGLFRRNSCTSKFLRLFRKSRGAFFLGGPDIPPSVYGEPLHLLTRVTDPSRHYLELSFLFHLLGGSRDPHWEPYMDAREEYLISGICLGMQTMNVATGGTLIQDIPSELYGIWHVEDLLSLDPGNIHRNYKGLLETDCQAFTSYHFHPINTEPGSFLARGQEGMKGTGPEVLSSHHQAIGLLGEGWTVAARSPDGRIIEAIEHIRYPHVFGVQFHPEKPGLYDPGIEHPVTCGVTVRFYERIRNSGSEVFHRTYWKRISGILSEIR